jgi:hypothetical protein
MPKGYNGESCAEGIRACSTDRNPRRASEIFRHTKERGSWSDETVWQHLMSLLVNLPSARHRWPSRKPFLFLCPDGRYELYVAETHPRVLE